MSRGPLPTVLRTSRLRLDQPQRADVPAIVEICADPDVGRWIPVMPSPYRTEDAERFVDDFVPTGWATGREPTWVLRLPDGVVIGSVGVHVEREEIGFWLGRSHRGRGYMREAVDAVLDVWFQQGAERMVWKCLRGNRPSAALARAAGFRLQPTPPAGQGSDQDDPSRFLFAVLAAGDERAPQPGWPDLDEPALDDRPD